MYNKPMPTHCQELLVLLLNIVILVLVLGGYVYPVAAVQSSKLAALKRDCDAGRQESCRQIEAVASSKKSSDKDRISAISLVDDPAILRAIRAEASAKRKIFDAVTLRLSDLEAAAWKKAKDTDTADSYKQFLKSFPNPNPEISSEINERLAWQGALDLNTEEGYRSYLNGHRNSAHTFAALLAIDRFLWQRTQVQDSYEAYANYLNSRHTVAYAAEAQLRQSQILKDYPTLTQDQFSALRAKIEGVSAPLTIRDLYKAANKVPNPSVDTEPSTFRNGNSFRVETTSGGSRVIFIAEPRPGTAGSVLAAASAGDHVGIYYSPGTIQAALLVSGAYANLTKIGELRLFRSRRELERIGITDAESDIPFDEVWLPKDQGVMVLTARRIGKVWKDMLSSGSGQSPRVPPQKTDEGQRQSQNNPQVEAPSTPAAIALTGTVWRVHRLLNESDESQFCFQADGIVGFGTDCAPLKGSSWQQAGNFVSFVRQVPDSFVSRMLWPFRYQAVIKGNQMEGEEEDCYGERYFWTGTRVLPPSK